MNITKDDFDVWRSHPITKAFYAKFVEHIYKAEDLWGSAINGSNDANLPLLRAELRARMNLATHMLNIDHEDFEEKEDEERERDLSDRVQGIS